MTTAPLPMPPERVVLLDEGVRMVSPANLIYSTSPLSAVGADGFDYVIKGDADTEEGVQTIAAEAIGYMVATAVGIPVPPFGIGTTPQGRTVFASRKLTNAARDTEPWIAKTRDAIASIFALDVWLANNDRNVGGLLAEWTGTGVTIVAIDFEKSQCVRSKFPNVELAMLDPRKLWPHGVLGTMMRGTALPLTTMASCRAQRDQTLVAIAACVNSAFPAFTWHELTGEALCRRRDRLDALVREVWQ